MPITPITALQLITVTGTYRNLDATISQGSVEFRANIDAIRDSADNLIVVNALLTARLDVDGHFSIDVPATDDPDYQPRGWTYRVFERIVGQQQPRVYDIAIPFDAPGGTIDLADVSPVAASGGITQFVFGRAFSTDGLGAPAFYVGETEPVLAGFTVVVGDVWISSTGVRIMEP